MKMNNILTSRSHKSLLLLVIVIAAIFLGTEPADATDIRGQLLGKYPNGHTFPLMGARADLYMQTGANWTLIATWVTGNDGMYYMSNVAPGNYFLQVNGKFNYPIGVGAFQYQDIPVIVVPF